MNIKEEDMFLGERRVDGLMDFASGFSKKMKFSTGVGELRR